MADGIHGLITGQTRSGKTSLCKLWTRKLPRVLYLDRLADYTDGEIFEDFERAIDWWLERRAKPFRLIFRGAGLEAEDNRAFRGWLELIEHAQRTEKLPPVLVVMEEASFYSSTHNVDPIVRALYLYGARHKISLVSIVQTDVLAHPLIRANTHWMASMRIVKPSSEQVAVFGRENLMRLETYNPTTVKRPEKGKHYVTYPPDADPETEMRRTLTGRT